MKDILSPRNPPDISNLLNNDQFFVEVDGGRSLRSVTEDDVAQMVAGRLQGKDCSHLIRFDEGHFAYTLRYCAFCFKVTGGLI